MPTRRAHTFPTSRAGRAAAGLRLLAGMARARLRGRPFLLSHLVTARCNASCPTCLWRDDEAAELPTDSVVWLYHEAAAAGMTQVVVWGGEPLLRADLPELLAAARAVGLIVTLITNGRLLAQRWPELRGQIDALILSLDDTGPAHDRLRGLPGLFEQLEAAVALLEGDPLRPKLLVNTVLSRLNPGALRRVAPVARRWGAGVYFCPMETGRRESTGFAATRAHLALSPEQIREAARLARLLQTAGYPLLASRRYLDLLEKDPGLNTYTCRAPRAIFTVEADGAVRDCLRRDRPLAYVEQLRARGTDLAGVFALPRFRAMLAEAEECTACNNPDALEMSWLWDLDPHMLEKAWQLVGVHASTAARGARSRRGSEL